ncbi:hypothetical protein GN244_ATG10014 [Phytophthora infestans]|uniref:Uncharacterized protein n=1 Tax=Phytophthora infestans TaxID=4787 RepID=A0A833S1E4_PHYIN|nr:hypothetical protein GN244_ATG10014 [Phytophthora infestans]KAF4149521.1 hypothetical protein GN958_ATG01284 [Phytophthora infestans]
MVEDIVGRQLDMALVRSSSPRIRPCSYYNPPQPRVVVRCFLGHEAYGLVRELGTAATGVVLRSKFLVVACQMQDDVVVTRDWQRFAISVAQPAPMKRVALSFEEEREMPLLATIAENRRMTP